MKLKLSLVLMGCLAFWGADAFAKPLEYSNCRDLPSLYLLPQSDAFKTKFSASLDNSSQSSIEIYNQFPEVFKSDLNKTEFSAYELNQIDIFRNVFVKKYRECGSELSENSKTALGTDANIARLNSYLDEYVLRLADGFGDKINNATKFKVEDLYNYKREFDDVFYTYSGFYNGLIETKPALLNKLKTAEAKIKLAIEQAYAIDARGGTCLIEDNKKAYLLMPTYSFNHKTFPQFNGAVTPRKILFAVDANGHSTNIKASPPFTKSDFKSEKDIAKANEEIGNYISTAVIYPPAKNCIGQIGVGETTVDLYHIHHH
ncbi:hypothetical protein [Pseudaquidulcibacter saccharophilus]|uniref:hypothetical protein n=1 Tax=Pseudaquidulcibacter saccharophilus TaxID=2831900 RepID=UPI001EFF0FAF|nr:hypothetical protein [Pseudaquidulcibacter saccharophilus]